MGFSYSYSMGNDAMEGMIAVFLIYLVYFLIVAAFGITMYVFRSLGVYTIAKRRGLRHPWFAWVPLVNQYLLGSISDQYQYVVKGKNKNKRKWLLALNIILAITYVVMMVISLSTVFRLTGNMMTGHNGMDTAMRSVVSAAITAIMMLFFAVMLAVIRYIALHDVYVSADPGNSTIYTVLSILLPVSEPFFLFFSRKKDDGMPPRRDAKPAAEPVWEEAKAEESWANE